MASEVKLEKFQGPLDLLLQLIELEKMDITEIALSEVTEQFLAYLDKLEHDRSEELADFLVIATKLVYLKSKTLLPYLYPEEEEGPGLADQLKMYQKYIEASQKVSILWERNNISYGRVEPPIKAEGFQLPTNARADDLHSSMVQLVGRLKPINPLPKVTIDRAISVKQKVEAIFAALKKHQKIKFKEILDNAESKTEVIVSFLALLDLLKQNRAFIEQGESFGDMEISAL